MRSLATLSRLSFSASVIAVAAMYSAPALAQSAPAKAPGATATDQPDPECAKPEGSIHDQCTSGEVETKSGRAAKPSNPDSIVVTGSRIRRPNLTSPVPITSVSGEELTSRGSVSVGDALNELPALRSTFSQANSTRFIGTAGVNVLDLRGLGTSRTLVLVNGRRHVTYTPGNYLVDVQTIPTDLIERVDVITGGSSAVYGSDAVAGVVNFVLKRNFDGLRLRAQTGISSHNDRAIKFISGTYGRNFFDDRANVAVNVEYDKADPLYFIDRPDQTGAYAGRCQFNLAGGTYTNQYFCGVRNASISDGGLVTAPISTASCENPAILNNPTSAALCLYPGTSRGVPRFLTFSPNGSLCEEIPAVDFRPYGSGNYIANPTSQCSPGSTLRNTGQIAPGLNRYTANLLAHFDVSKALKPFVEAKFVRVDALQEGQPSFFQGTFAGFFGGGTGIRCDNPFLTPQDITALQSIGRCAGGPTSTQTIPLARFNTDFGGRAEHVRRDTYRIVGGITGDFNSGWNYEVSVNYGHVRTSQAEANDLHIFNVDAQGNITGNGPFLNAIDAVRLPSGQIVCRINATPNPAVNDPACVPIDVFGTNQPSQAALNYVNTTSHVYSKASELDALAYVNGDSSQLFSLPGGPVRFSVGGEHREERADRVADIVSASGGTFFNAFKPFKPPVFKVSEAFGELELPVVKDLPFAQEFTVSGAARYSHYNTSAKNTFAWNANAVYAPVRDLKFRANYSKSVRVPTQADLFSPASQNFGFVNDPCDVLYIKQGTQYRAANCAALGIPAGFVNTVARSQTIGFQSGGNPALKAETGRSLTVGGVLTPRWVPGLSMTVDYYRIRVKNLISVLSAQQIINACVDLPTTTNQYCPTIKRNPDNTFATPALLSSGINFAKQEADGVDFELAYRHNFANKSRLNFHGIATRVLKRNNFIDPTVPTYADRQLLELGDPKWEANANIEYGTGPIDLRWSMNYVGKQTIGESENYFQTQDRPPINPNYTAERFYPAALYHSVRVDFRPRRDLKNVIDYYVGVDNLFNKKPPYGLLGNEAANPYEPIGRYYYLGVAVGL